MTTQSINIDSRNLSDLWLLSNGGFDPLRGDGEPLPAEITRPEVAAVLREAFARPEVLRA